MNKLLRNHQADFGKERHIMLGSDIIEKQELKRESSLCINFIVFEKVFDSVDRDSFWKIMRYYGIPNKSHQENLPGHKMQDTE